jgi:hypothetical protein
MLARCLQKPPCFDFIGIEGIEGIERIEAQRNELLPR